MAFSPLFLQWLLGVGARPLQGFMRNAFPDKNKESTNCGLLTPCVALGVLRLHMYTGE